jgi:hypothetical protein
VSQLSSYCDLRARPGEPPGAADRPAGRGRERLLGLREAYPFDEFVVWARLPGVPLGMALAHLEALAAEVAPALAVSAR